MLNILLDLIIRLGALAAVSSGGGTSGEAEHVAHTLFLSLLIVMALSCLPVYAFWTRRIPTFRVIVAGALLASVSATVDTYARVFRRVRGLAISEFATFFITLAARRAAPRAARGLRRIPSGSALRASWAPSTSRTGRWPARSPSWCAPSVGSLTDGYTCAA